MRTKLLFTSFLIAVAGLVYSQSFEIVWEGEVLEPNAEITVEGPVTEFEIVAEVDITYNGSSVVDVVCQRYELDMVPSTTSAICWGGLCYGPGTSLSPVAWSMNPGELYENVFSGHYYPAGISGVSTIAYTFYDENNPSDSAMLTVVFDGLQVGINEVAKSVAFEVYPNPSSNFINVEMNMEMIRGAATIQMIDITGAVVAEVVTTEPAVRISTAELAEGMYMCRAVANNILLASDKIIVRH